MKILKLGEPPYKDMKASGRFQMKISWLPKAPNEDFEDFGALERRGVPPKNVFFCFSFSNPLLGIFRDLWGSHLWTSLGLSRDLWGCLGISLWESLGIMVLLTPAISSNISIESIAHFIG